MEPDTSTQSIPPAAPQIPIQPPIPEKHKSPIFLWLLILALAGVALYFGYQNWQLKKQVSQVQPTTTPFITPTTAPDPTASWKTYINTSASYEVKYPSNWKIENQAAGSFGNEPPSNSTFIEIYKPQSDPTKSLGNIGFEELGMIPPSEKSLLNKTKVVNGQTLQCYGEETPNSKFWCFIKVPNENKYLSIHIFKNIDDNVNRTFDQILSTFKFINPTPSTSDQTQSTQIPGWKYYSNDDFTFQYPGDWTIGQGGQALVADTAGAGATIFSKNTPMYNECMKLDKTDTVGGKMVKYYSYVYSGEACSNQTNIGNYEIWITKAGGDGFQPGIIYMYNTTIYPKSFNIFQQILSTFKFKS